MPAALFLLAALALGLVLPAGASTPSNAPSYSSASLVNSADFQPGPLAPNTIATLFGTNLAHTTTALTEDEIKGGSIPTLLIGTGVTVAVGGIAAGLYYVSPTQINFLVPSIIVPGPSDVQVIVEGLAGPDISVQIAPASPAFFQLDAQTVIATHLDGSLVTAAAPAQAGEYVVLYATGLGQANPPIGNLEVATEAQSLNDLSSLQITLGGQAVDSKDIAYAGLAPGFAGLYQINLKLPGWVGTTPQIQIALGSQISPKGIVLPVQ